MKRRSFLKTLPVLAATPLAMAAKPTPYPINSRHLIALGTAACRLPSNHYGQLKFDTITHIDRVYPSENRLESTFIKFIPPEYFFEQLETLRIVKGEYFPILPLPLEIKTHLESLSGDVVFLAGLGGVTAALLSQSIGCHYSNHRQTWNGWP